MNCFSFRGWPNRELNSPLNESELASWHHESNLTCKQGKRFWEAQIAQSKYKYQANSQQEDQPFVVAQSLKTKQHNSGSVITDKIPHTCTQCHNDKFLELERKYEQICEELKSVTLRLEETSKKLKEKCEEEKQSLKLKDEIIKRVTDEKKELEKKLKQAKEERESLKSNVQETEKYDMMFRGGSHNPEDSARSFFNEGIYCEVWEKMEDWNDLDLGNLLVGTAKHAFASVRDTIMWGTQVLMIELFKYKEEVFISPEERQRMEDISHAYGILLYYFKEVFWDENPGMFTTKIETDRNFHELYHRAKSGNHKAVFSEFCKKMLQEMRNMLTVSPPMIIHMPLEYKKQMTDKILHISTKCPLVYTRPVIMNNYCGTVCLKGRAGNKDEMNQQH